MQGTGAHVTCDMCNSRLGVDSGSAVAGRAGLRPSQCLDAIEEGVHDGKCRCSPLGAGDAARFVRRAVEGLTGGACPDGEVGALWGQRRREVSRDVACVCSSRQRAQLLRLMATLVINDSTPGTPGVHSKCGHRSDQASRPAYGWLLCLVASGNAH
jgi:hypothetical protein